MHILHVMLNHELEVHIDLDALRLVHHLPLRFLLLHVLHPLPPVLPVLLQPLNLLQTVGLLALVGSGHYCLLTLQHYLLQGWSIGCSSINERVRGLGYGHGYFSRGETYSIHLIVIHII